MIKFARVINTETGLCEVGLGTNSTFYASIGMTELDVQLSDVDNLWYLIDKCPMKTEEEKDKEERERLDMLSMTRGDVFEAMILAHGLNEEAITAMINEIDVDKTTKALYLNRLKNANDFFRGYPVFDLLGEKLNITSKMLDNFFETKDYHYLTNCTFDVTTTPEGATVTINNESVNKVTVPYNSTINYIVTMDGYKASGGNFIIKENTSTNAELQPLEDVDGE